MSATIPAAARTAATAPQRRDAIGPAIAVLAVAAALGAIGIWSRDYTQFVTELVLLNAIAAMGVNIGMGFAGLVSIGHAGFAAIGAYTATLLMMVWHVPYLVAMLGGAVTAAVAGIIVGLPALRLTPLYIAMITFGFGLAVQQVALNWVDVTRGPNGLAVSDIALFGAPASALDLYILAVVLFALAFVVCWNIRRTYFGRALLAVRGSAVAAQSMGIPVARYKTIAFGISAFYGGLSGALYAAVSGYVNPEAFTFGISISYVTMSVVGGIGTLAGPLVGAAVLTVLPELLRAYAEYKEFITGVILLVFIVMLPGGLVGLAGSGAALLRRWAAK